VYYAPVTKPNCSIDNCPNVAQAKGKGMCWKHYRASRPLSCSVDDCSKTVTAAGLCVVHYTRQQRYGDVSTTAFIKGDDEARFWSHVDRRGDDECWPWTAYTDRKGYGVFNVEGRPRPVHRWAYHHFVGPVPDEMTIDHVRARGCTRKDCVNFLSHLEIVTNKENVMRSDGACATNARKTHCIRDHEFTSENTLVRKNGGRTCRACKKLREQGLV
jgi:hypothetical protein